MYYYLSGKIAHLEASLVVLDVNGVGYEVRITVPTYSALKDQTTAKLFTHFQVAESIQALFGFLTRQEKNLFLQIIGVSGIGTATGLTLLSSMSAGEFVHAVLTEDTKSIEAVKGIGPKTAKRVVLELKDKVKKGEDLPHPSATVSSSLMSSSIREEALEALMALGIQKAAAEKSISTILKSQGSNITLEQLIKLSLKTR